MRKSGFMIYATQICCERENCDARESTVITNEGGDKKAWRCPTCGAKAKVRRRLSLADYQQEQLANDARARRLRDWR
jgi:hypothetical protein